MAEIRNLSFILKGAPLEHDLQGKTARIELRVQAKQITGTNKGGMVDNIRLSLKKAAGDGSDKIDVLYDDLLKTENLNKQFTIRGVDLDKATFTNPNRLLLSREAYYNVAPIQKIVSPTIQKSNWKKPTISNDFTQLNGAAATDNEWNQEIRKYNQELEENDVIKWFDFLDDEFNSTGQFRELQKDWEDKVNAAGLKYRTSNLYTKLAEIGAGVASREKRIEILRDYSAFLEADLTKKENLIAEGKKKIEDWRNAGGLTDDEYNQEVDSYSPDDSIVKTYNELRDKTNNEEKYKPFKARFDSESKTEAEPGVAAEKDLTVNLPEKVVDGDNKDEAKAKKNNYKNLLTLRTKILARKKAVVDLIEGLVTGDAGGDDDKLTCPNCKQKFDTLPFEYNGKKYHSQQCADEAKRKEQDDQNDNQGIAQVQTKAIQAINEALNEDPKIATSDLDSDFQNWENQIKGLNVEKDINDFRDRVLANIQKKRKEKQTEEEANKYKEGINEATGQDLINRIKKLENLDGTKVYEEELKSLIDQNLDRVFQENEENAKELIKAIVEAKMTKCEVSEDELGNEEKELFTKIKNKEINDKDQLKNAKKTLVEFIGNKNIEKRIESLKKEVEAAHSEDQKKEVRSKLIKLLNGENNIYIKNWKTNIEDLLKKLESNTTDTNNEPGIPWKVILPIAAVAVVVIIGAVLVVRKRKNQKEIRDLED